MWTHFYISVYISVLCFTIPLYEHMLIYLTKPWLLDIQSCFQLFTITTHRHQYFQWETMYNSQLHYLNLLQYHGHEAEDQHYHSIL